MIEVDGSAGGGQLLRSALSLSMLTDEAVEIADVRGDRSEPGLKAQHLTVVETAAAVCDADVSGADHGSESVTFDPGPPAGGTYEAHVGTAGSLTLLFDAFLPLATRLDEPLTIEATGGTDVKWSPPLASSRRVKLPLLRSFGLAATVEPERTGFYPQGGGAATLRVWPSTMTPLDLSDPGPVTGARVYSKASEGLGDANVAERQAGTAAARLDEAGVDTVERVTSYVETASPGSVVVVRLDRGGCSGAVAGVDAYGERGTPAETVAERAVADADAVLDGDAAVDDHLADQLVVFLSLVGGRVPIPRVTDHVASSLDLLETFGYAVTLDDSGPRTVLEAE